MMTASFVISLVTGVTIAMVLALIIARASWRRRAATRHALLVAAFGVALILPIASAVAPFLTWQVAVPAPAVVSSAVASFDQIPEPIVHNTADTERAREMPVPRPQTSVTKLVTATWLVGVAVCLIPIFVGLAEMRSLSARSVPWLRGGDVTRALSTALDIRRPVSVRLHGSISGPMTFGTARPSIVMPVDAESWTGDDLTRALVHELEHIRRADWLTQCLARTVCAVYWFHPLVWMARRQLILEAECASDDAVLRYADAAAYADQLVDLARRLSGPHRPALAMANRRDLATRVHALLDSRQSRGRAGAALVTSVSCLATLLVIVMSPMRVVARSPVWQSTGTGARFDVVAIRPCDPNAAPAGGAARGSNMGTSSPGRLVFECQSLFSLMNMAYISYAGGRVNPASARPTFNPETVPSWVLSERFTIEATSDPATSPLAMRGPMLQAVLEERFGVKVHIDTRDMPIYELIVANGGSKLTPFTSGECVPYDWSLFPQPALAPGERRCASSTSKDRDGNWVDAAQGVTLDDWASGLRLDDRPVVNTTGIVGPVSFRLVYSGGSAGFAAAVKNQLGLDLRDATGPRQYLILDHVEHLKEK
jgi:uncharacterized protein (TIGR03435 family)